MNSGHAKYLRDSLSFRRLLLAWYDANARDLPWRETHDPYRVWLSEVMLQQTRVAAVIAHYHEFLRRYPTVQKLAAAKESSVLAVWSGLGYYRRARMLHAAAKIIARELRGGFPQTEKAWQDLPGIGRYTSAAIASIAFNEPIAAVDGNIERVLQRITGCRLAGEDLWRAAENLLDRSRPGDFNQAMMELGATICTPRSPACLTCPVIDACATRGELPALERKAPQQKRAVHYALHHRNGGVRKAQVLLLQRPRDASLMAGMWELPEIPPPNGSAQSFEKPQNDTQDDTKLSLLFTVRHSITVTNYTVSVWSCDTPNHSRGEWMPLAKLGKLPLTGLARKILRKAELLS